jgi:hypothetical protein
MALPKINMILRGTFAGGDSNNRKSKYRKKVLTTTRSLVQWHEPIIFTHIDEEKVVFPHKDALIISTIIYNHRVHQVLIDDDGTVNILFAEVMVQIGIPFSKLTPIKTPLIDIEGSGVLVKGVLEFPIILGTPPKCVSLRQSFMVIDMALAYNAILGIPFLDQINVIINTRYLTLKLPTQKGVATAREDQTISKQCASTCLKGKKILILGQKGS